MRGAWLAVVCALSAAGCIPSRDNGNDPTVAPRAELVVLLRDRLPSGACDASSAGIPILSASRGACLTLDASGSVDPQRHALEYRWEYAGPDEPAPRELEAADEMSSTFALSSATNLLPSLSVGADLTHVFRVVVTDRSGFTASAKAELALTNSPPVPDADLVRTLPSSGAPWLPGQPIEIPFSAAGATDPDGDVLHYCWIVDGVALPCVSGDSTVTVPIELTSANVMRRVLARVRVHDNDPTLPEGPAHRVTEAVAEVMIRSSNVWLLDGTAPAAVLRLETVPLGIGFHADDRIIHAAMYSAADPAEKRLVITDASELDGGNARLYTTDWPFWTANPTFVPLPDGFSRVITDASRQRVYTVTRLGTVPPADDEPHDEKVSIFDVTGPDTLVATGQAPPSLAPFDGTARLLHALDDEGCLWISHFYAHALVRVCGGTSTSYSPPAGFAITGLSNRPGTGEMWIAEVPDGTGEALPEARFVGLSSAGPILEVHSVPADGSVAYGPAFSSADEMWAFLPGTGVVRLDVARMLTGTVEDAILVATPVLDVATNLIIDAGTGTLWAFPESVAPIPGGPEPLFARVYGSGAADVFAGWVFPQLIDDAGLFWFTRTPTSDNLAPSTGPGPGDTIALTLPLSGTAHGSYSVLDGGAWVYRREESFAEPPSLTLYAQDGRVRRRLETVRYATGGTARLPSFDHFVVSPDGEDAWGFESEPPFSLRHIDLDTANQRPVASAIIGSAQTVVPPLLAASAPVPGSQPFAWTFTFEGGANPLNVTAIESDGTAHVRKEIDTAVELPGYPAVATQDAPRGVRAPGSNRLCLLTQTAGDSGYLHWVNPPGSATSFDYMGVANDLGAEPVAMSAAWDGDIGGSGYDVCSVAYDDGCTGGTARVDTWWCDPVCEPDTINLSGNRIRSVLTVSSEEVYVRVEDRSTGDEYLVHVQDNVVQYHALDGVTADQLLQP